MISPELGSWRCLTIYCKLKTRLWVFLCIVINYSCQTQEDPPCCLQSLLRSQRQARHGEPDGNLLKAGSERTPKTINVEFTGTRTDDPATGMSNAKSMVIFDYEGRTTQVFLFYMAVSLKDWDLPNSRNQWFCACYESAYISYHMSYPCISIQPREIKVHLFWRMWTAWYLSLELNAVIQYLA